jgi:hypothetical protein
LGSDTDGGDAQAARRPVARTVIQAHLVPLPYPASCARRSADSPQYPALYHSRFALLTKGMSCLALAPTLITQIIYVNRGRYSTSMSSDQARAVGGLTSRNRTEAETLGRAYGGAAQGNRVRNSGHCECRVFCYRRPRSRRTTSNCTENLSPASLPTARDFCRNSRSSKPPCAGDGLRFMRPGRLRKIICAAA